MNKVVHVGVREGNCWQELEFTTDTRGMGRQVNEEDPEFEIDIYRSPQLKETSNDKLEFDITNKSSLVRTEKMFSLGRKRSRTDPGNGES